VPLRVVCRKSRFLAGRPCPSCQLGDVGP
jgi:Zn ribbon nucleic-acid-binding protein